MDPGGFSKNEMNEGGLFGWLFSPRQETYYWGAGFCDHQPRCGAENIQGVELGKAVASMVIHGYTMLYHCHISLGFIGIC